MRGLGGDFAAKDVNIIGSKVFKCSFMFLLITFSSYYACKSNWSLLVIGFRSKRRKEMDEFHTFKT